MTDPGKRIEGTVSIALVTGLVRPLSMKNHRNGVAAQLRINRPVGKRMASRLRPATAEGNALETRNVLYWLCSHNVAHAGGKQP